MCKQINLRVMEMSELNTSSLPKNTNSELLAELNFTRKLLSDHFYITRGNSLDDYDHLQEWDKKLEKYCIEQLNCHAVSVRF